MLQVLEPDCPDVALWSDVPQPLGHGLQLGLGDLGRQRARLHGVGELLLHRARVGKEGLRLKKEIRHFDLYPQNQGSHLVVLYLLVEDGCRLLIQLCRDVV